MGILMIFLLFGVEGTNKETRFWETFRKKIWTKILKKNLRKVSKFHIEATGATGTYYEISPSQQLSLLNEILECPGETVTTGSGKLKPEVANKTGCKKYENFVSPNDGQETEVKVNFYVEEWVIPNDVIEMSHDE